jgi:hypothetical protein
VKSKYRMLRRLPTPWTGVGVVELTRGASGTISFGSGDGGSVPAQRGRPREPRYAQLVSDPLVIRAPSGRPQARRPLAARKASSLAGIALAEVVAFLVCARARC